MPCVAQYKFAVNRHGSRGYLVTKRDSSGVLCSASDTAAIPTARINAPLAILLLTITLLTLRPLLFVAIVVPMQ